nr:MULTISPECIES: IS5 family transposase [unclassified Okeania]
MYRLKNWSEYDASLKQRGSLTFWLTPEAIEQWLNQKKTGRRGASNNYSDTAIELMVTMQSLYSLAGRQTEGFVKSIFQLMDLDLPVPDHSTVSRRLPKLNVKLPVIPTNEAIHMVVDSTGVKVYGEGEWKTRVHGVSKRRTWRKLHLGVSEATGEIISGVVTTNDVSDDQVFSDLLDGVDGEIAQVSGDGAYDKYKCYEKARQRGAKATIPPRKNAVIGQHGNCKCSPHPRDENLRRIRKVGRKKWKRECGYHRRSLSETTMFRLKVLNGCKLRRRKFDNQAVELFIQCSILNVMIQNGKPQSYKVEI